MDRLAHVPISRLLTLDIPRIRAAATALIAVTALALAILVPNLRGTPTASATTNRRNTTSATEQQRSLRSS